MSKITPHDWRTRTSQYEPEAFDIVQPGIGAIALVKNEQFALLIAAAPELLGALQEILDCDKTQTSFGAVMRARAAITKATGAQA